MTKQEIIQRLQDLGASPKRSLGQNFLVGDTVSLKILAKLSRLPDARIVEIGPGLGALTEKLKLRDPNLLVVELDNAFAEYWQQQGVEVIHADALKVNWGEPPLSQCSVLVSNLPYQISSSLVIEMSMLEGQSSLEVMVLMFQKEVAQRIVAEPGTANYGFLSVLAQRFWEISLVLDAGPNEFYPPPKIASRVLQFRRKSTGIEDPQFYLKLVKQAFSQRRKKMIKNLSPLFRPEGVQAPDVEKVFDEYGLSHDSRAEVVSPEAFESLYRLFLV